MKTLDPSPFVLAARNLLNRGDAVGAERVLAPMLKQLRSDAPALHLMGLICKAQNDFAGAERHFRSAIAYNLSEGAYYNDLGVVLQARGEFTEAKRVFRAALALLPAAAAIRVNLVRCMLAANELADAEAEARAYISAHPGPEGWTLLMQVQRAQERNEDALVSAQTALAFDPDLRGLRYNHAVSLERAGRQAEALAVYEKLARQDIDTPELALNYARALYADGRRNDAEAVAIKAVGLWPGSSLLHGTLARMRWLRGEGEAATELLEAEIARRPNDLALRLACADALHRGQHLQKALRVLDEAVRIAPEAPAILTALGVVLDELDRPLDGIKVLRRAVELTNGSTNAQRNLLSTLLRSGRPEEAHAIVRRLRASDPDEQYLLACETVALRLMGSPHYRSFCDFERYVRSYEIPAPHGFFSKLDFNAALAEALRTQHKLNAHPLDQHLHNGAQTARTLLAAPDPVIKTFMAAIDPCVRDYIKRLPEEASDPVGRRRGRHYRYSGLWSTRLANEGYMPNHVHDRGWISSAYFVALTPAERARDPRAGWLKLGEPNRAPANCGPEKLIEPKLGLLVLFPSYFWHGVIPFAGAERLSAAFDVVPG